MYNIFFICLNIFLIFFTLLNYKIIAKKFNLIDRPNKTNIHKKNIPLAGGLFIILSLIIWLFSLFFLDIIYFREFIGYFILISFSFFINFLDDKSNLDPLKRIFFLFLVSLISLSILEPYLEINKIYFINFDKSITTSDLNIFLFAVCIVILQVIFNLMDGINGLLKLYSVCLLLIFAFKDYLFFNDLIFYIFPTLLILIILNFQNFLFLGSTGNSMLSIIFSIIILKTNSANFQIISFEQVFLFFSFPLIDTLRLFIVRLINNGNAFIKQKNHLHHILFFRFNNQIAVLIYILIGLIPSILFEFIKLDINLCIMISFISYFIIYKFFK